jgi:hypothetical protein
MRDARQNQKEIELAFRGAAQHPRDADLVSQLFERKQHSENLAAGHLSPAQPSNSPFTRRSMAAIRSGGQFVRLAIVRVQTLPPSR